MAIFNLLFIFIKLLNLWLTFQLKFKISPEVKIIHPTIISQKRPEGTVSIGIIIIQPVVVGVTIIESNVRFHHVAVPPLPRCCDKTSRSGRYPYLNRKIESMKRKHTLPTSIGAEMPNTVASNPAADIVVSRSPELTCRMQLPIIPPPYTARYRKTSVRPPPLSRALQSRNFIISIPLTFARQSPRRQLAMLLEHGFTPGRPPRAERPSQEGMCDLFILISSLRGTYRTYLHPVVHLLSSATYSFVFRTAPERQARGAIQFNRTTTDGDLQGMSRHHRLFLC